MTKTFQAALAQDTEGAGAQRKGPGCQVTEGAQEGHASVTRTNGKPLVQLQLTAVTEILLPSLRVIFPSWDVRMEAEAPSRRISRHFAGRSSVGRSALSLAWVSRPLSSLRRTHSMLPWLVLHFFLRHPDSSVRPVPPLRPPRALLRPCVWEQVSLQPREASTCCSQCGSSQQRTVHRGRADQDPALRRLHLSTR